MSLERKHVILNEVKDLDPVMQVILECSNKISFDLAQGRLRLRPRMTYFTKCLCSLLALPCRYGTTHRARNRSRASMSS
jgi:hypothetical protein